jgi:hypothetical protein
VNFASSTRASSGGVNCALSQRHALHTLPVGYVRDPLSNASLMCLVHRAHLPHLLVLCCSCFALVVRNAYAACRAVPIRSSHIYSLMTSRVKVVKTLGALALTALLCYGLLYAASIIHKQQLSLLHKELLSVHARQREPEDTKEANMPQKQRAPGGVSPDAALPAATAAHNHSFVLQFDGVIIAQCDSGGVCPLIAATAPVVVTKVSSFSDVALEFGKGDATLYRNM